MKTIFFLCCFFSCNIILAQNVGIGNNNPQEKLSVNGGIQVGYTSTTNNQGAIRNNDDGLEYT